MKNKLAYIILNDVKKNIINNKRPYHNPILLEGLEKEKRYRIFWAVFNKTFNLKYKKTYRYLLVDKMNLENISDKKMIILENIEKLENNKELQTKILNIINKCLENNIQLILCSKENVKELNISDLLKSKIMSGMIVYLNEEKKVK